jgi:hypothetical protein
MYRKSCASTRRWGKLKKAETPGIAATRVFLGPHYTQLSGWHVPEATTAGEVPWSGRQLRNNESGRVPRNDGFGGRGREQRAEAVA